MTSWGKTKRTLRLISMTYFLSLRLGCRQLKLDELDLSPGSQLLTMHGQHAQDAGATLVRGKVRDLLMEGDRAVGIALTDAEGQERELKLVSTPLLFGWR